MEFQFNRFAFAVLLINTAHLAYAGVCSGDDIAIFLKLAVCPFDLPAGEESELSCWALVLYSWWAVAHLPAGCLACPEIGSAFLGELLFFAQGLF